MSSELDSARRAKAALAARLGDHPAVRGIGVARSGDGYAVKLNLAERSPRGLAVPDVVDGVPVVVEVVGRIAAS